ncbi:hypothetical protein VM1G_05221 [Cytospora mali]|uniref:Uncharacterized protein n=1 Tax=Cytospora mali TaxID=578113 RepID=A0A194W0C4_CYTMA|nr:hypothetical protein VM1G_05221 [Valsa mali]
MATTTSSSFPLATLDPYTGGDGDTAGTANSGSNGTPDNDAGASGASGGQTFDISTGALIAIILIVVFVALLGIGTGTLFYIAKKREWKVRETIRKSAKKVVTALTPRRTEFPRSVKEGSVRSGKSGRLRGGRVRMDDVPPTPRLKPEDLEKGLAAKVDVKRKHFNRK